MYKQFILGVVFLLISIAGFSQVYSWQSNNGKEGLKDKNGTILLQATFNEVEVEKINNEYFVFIMNDDIGELYKLVNNKLKPMAKNIIDIDISHSSNKQNHQTIFVISTKERSFIINSNGEELYSIDKPSEPDIYYYTMENAYRVVFGYNNISYEGLVTTDGKLIIPPLYYDIELRRPKYAHYICEMRNEEGKNKYDIYDLDGQLILSDSAYDIDADYIDNMLMITFDISEEYNRKRAYALISNDNKLTLPYTVFDFSFEHKALINQSNGVKENNIDPYYLILEDLNSISDVDITNDFIVIERNSDTSVIFCRNTTKWDNRIFSEVDVKGEFIIGETDTSLIVFDKNLNEIIVESSEGNINYVNDYFSYFNADYTYFTTKKGKKIKIKDQGRNYNWTGSYYIKEINSEDDEYMMMFNKKGQTINDLKFYEYEIIDDLGVFVLNKEDDYYYLVDFDGNLHPDIVVEDVWEIQDFFDYHPGASFFRFINKKGDYKLFTLGLNEITEYFLYDPYYDEGDYLLVKKDELFGVIDLQGNTIIPIKYKQFEMDYLFDSYYKFLICETPDNKYTIYNTNNLNNFINVDSIKSYYEMFLEGEMHYFPVKQNGKWGVIDHNLNWLVKPEFDNIHIEYLEDNYPLQVFKKIDGKYKNAFMHHTGEYITEFFPVVDYYSIIGAFEDNQDIFVYSLEKDGNYMTGIVSKKYNKAFLNLSVDEATSYNDHLVFLYDYNMNYYAMYDFMMDKFIEPESPITEIIVNEFAPKVRLKSDDKWYYFIKGKFILAD